MAVFLNLNNTTANSHFFQDRFKFLPKARIFEAGSLPGQTIGRTGLPGRAQ